MLDSAPTPVNIVRQQDELLFRNILFERPINRLRARNITLLAGRHAKLKQIHDAYQLINIMNHHSRLIAAHALRTRDVPADVFLKPDIKNELHFANTEQVMEIVNDSAFVIMGLELEISSKYQILVEKVISSTQTPILATNSLLPIVKTSPGLLKNHKGVFVLDTKSLIRLANMANLAVSLKAGAGINNKLSVIRLLADSLSWPVVCYETSQVISCNPAQSGRFGVTNFKTTNKLEVETMVVAILSCLLADSRLWQHDFLERSLTAAFLLRQVTKTNNSSLDKKLQAVLEKYQ
ncbi:hypothetical protein HYX70_01070 [Candidatus Saccharibacteria bacterium]|nr:hypothetical protein [Candidatus Saccharibacteria bacterium]